MPWSVWDVGGCNCDCVAFPCNLPPINLQIQGELNGDFPTATLFYGTEATCQWISPVFELNGGFYSFVINSFQPPPTIYTVSQHSSMTGPIIGQAQCFVGPGGEIDPGSNTMHLTQSDCGANLHITFVSEQFPFGGNWLVTFLPAAMMRRRSPAKPGGCCPPNPMAL